MVHTEQRSKNTARSFAVITILSLFVLGNATGIFASFSTFFRTISLDSNPLPEYGYGYGYDGSYGYGYGYGYDTNPNPFDFTPLVGKEISTLYSSNSITVSGINQPSNISIAGGEYLITRMISYNFPGIETANADMLEEYTSAPGTVYDGDVVTVRLTSSNLFSTAKSATLTVGSGSAVFTVTTRTYGGNGGSGGYMGGGSGGSSGSGTTRTNSGTVTPPVSNTGAVTNTGSTRPQVVVTPNSDNGSDNVVIKSPSGYDIPLIKKCGIKFSGVKVLKKDIKLWDTKKNWAREYIERLTMIGVVDNVDRFRPRDNVTRAEFLKLVMKAGGCNPDVSTTNVFKDVAKDAWYAPYVALALDENIISDSFDRFRPNDSITRGEATKILVGVFNVSFEVDSNTFSDVNPDDDLAKYIEAAKSLGFFDGQIKNGKQTFRPNDAITREEVAKVVAVVFNFPSTTEAAGIQ
jgi:hypothetical protein